MLTHSKDPEGWKKEIASICQVLEMDNKNYHAWAYRVWVCNKFQLYEEEKDQIEWMLEVDIGNNSAWVYRRFLKDNLLEKGKIESLEVLVAEELNYVEKKLEK